MVSLADYRFISIFGSERDQSKEIARGREAQRRADEDYPPPEGWQVVFAGEGYIVKECSFPSWHCYETEELALAEAKTRRELLDMLIAIRAFGVNGAVKIRGD